MRIYLAITVTCVPYSRKQMPVNTNLASQTCFRAINCMIAMRFVDTNILIYAVGKRSNELGKRQAARRILESEDFAVSVQVLQEFYVQSTRISSPVGMSHEWASRIIDGLIESDGVKIQANTPEILLAALAIRARFALNFWDCTILAAAQACGCEEVFSEDFNHQLDYGGVRVINPFVDLSRPSA